MPGPTHHARLMGAPNSILRRCAFVAWCLVLSGASATLMVACSEELPDDIIGYRDRCIQMNAEPIEVTNDDPHLGIKNVYACDIAEADIPRAEDAADGNFVYPDGTIIVKESTRESQGYVWLVATARKANGAWTWNEYTRNFENDDFFHILSDESVCTDCHDDTRATDWIYTIYSP